MSKFFNELKSKISKSERLFISHSMDVAYILRKYINDNHLGNQDFAKIMNKQPSVITKWLSGNHNFTLETLSEIEAKTGVVMVRTLEAEEIDVPDRDGYFVSFEMTGAYIDINSEEEDFSNLKVVKSYSFFEEESIKAVA